MSKTSGFPIRGKAASVGHPTADQAVPLTARQVPPSPPAPSASAAPRTTSTTSATRPANTLQLPSNGAEAVSLVIQSTRSAAPRPRRIVLNNASPASSEPAPWHQVVLLWIASYWGRGYGVSLVLHSILLVALSITVMEGNVGNDGVNTFLSEFSNGDQATLENILDKGLDEAGGSSESVEVAAFTPTLVPEFSQPDLPVELAAIADQLEPLSAEAVGSLLDKVGSTKSSGKGSGKGSGIGAGEGTGGFAMPSQGRAVSQGSFTAWTVPENPRPGHGYLIIVQVDWGKSSTGRPNRRRGDLTGLIIGTDGYSQMIQRTGYFIPKSNQMVIPVPGAKRYVKDVIQVHSRSLDEHQELTITFQ